MKLLGRQHVKASSHLSFNVEPAENAFVPNVVVEVSFTPVAC